MTKVAPEEQFVHEGLIPAIIDKAEFEAVNATFTKRVENGVKAKGNLIYKYTGIMKCGECGKNLVTVSQVRSYGRKKCYICSTYNKYGKAYCSGHSISHDDLDSIIFKELESAEFEKLERQLIEAENEQELRDNEKEKVASAMS